MSTKSQHPSPTVRKRDPDFVKAETAIKRASETARERARKLGLGVIVQKEGQIVEECMDGTERPSSS